MEKQRAGRGHAVVLAAPGQSHINPRIQISRRLAWKGLKITWGVILSSIQSIQTENDSISRVSLYDGITHESRKLKEYPIKCLDGMKPLGFGYSKQLGIASAVFAHLSLSAMVTYYPLHLELSEEQPKLPPFMDPDDLPELETLVKQIGFFPFTFDKLEEDVLIWMTNLCPVTTIGPTVPSAYLDKRIKDDTDYSFNLYKTNSDTCINRLNTKDSTSVIYVLFGSFANAKPEQMTVALKQISKNFLWVV
ncbi:Glycosyltransferase [Quillaja saponaria]|uniref:Glycosyltransferase n=1 Tax=Quillaja saponaria TaxID=32244 RepID=A0AAD7M1N5_QUISA|nr:Glycosyltransferase [Quillaja saponaria]